VKAQDENWDPGTQDQARQTFALFNRFLAEVRKIKGFASLRQSDLASFVTFLRTEIYKFYGKSPRDETRTIAELREIAAAKDETLRGLVGATLNRHLGHIAQLARHARAQGIRIDRDLDFGDLRSRNKNGGRARDKRAKMPVNVTRRVFHAAPYVGCAAWDRPYEFKEGGFVYHRALYFEPMLLEYTGTRREETCGLCIDDVVTDGPIPYIHIRPNEFRRIKNPQSVRNIPLHPELLRLNFLEYVDLIRSLGYRRVFPDLHSPTSKSPSGDRFYDEFMPVLAWACKIEGVDLKVVLHSIRHGFNSRLKARNISVEDRADLMGHGGDSETSERYADPILLQKALDIIKQLPSVTDHLQPSPIQLLPWVQNREVAPFSRGRGRKKRA
jgi:integrase